MADIIGGSASEKPRSTLETFGRALQGFGYGMQGRTPPFMEQDLARERMAQEDRRAAQQQTQFEATLAESTRMHNAQIQQSRMETAKGAFSILDLLGKRAENFTPEERKEYGDILGPALLQGLSSDPKARSLTPEGASKIVDAFLQGRTGNLQALYTDLDPVQLQFLGQLEPAQIGAQADKFRASNVTELKNAMLQDLPRLRKAIEQTDPSRVGQPLPASLLLEHPVVKSFLGRHTTKQGLMNAAFAELLKDKDLLGQHQIVADVDAATVEKRLKSAQMQEAETSAAIRGKVLAVPAEGAVSIIGPPKEAGGPPSVSTTQIHGRKPPGEQTRFLEAEMRGALTGLDDLSARAEIGSSALFGVKSATEAFFARSKEQLGVGMSKKEYETFWADMRFARAKAIRALEKGNISQGDIQFFLAGFPEASDPASVGLIKTQATSQFVRERLQAIETEFTRTPAADPQEVAARISTQLVSRRGAAIRGLQASMARS